MTHFQHFPNIMDAEMINMAHTMMVPKEFGMANLDFYQAKETTNATWAGLVKHLLAASSALGAGKMEAL